MGAKLRIQKMQALAKQRDGKCLSTTYVNVKTKLCWRCAKGHEWEATSMTIKRGTGARRAVGRSD